MNLATLRSVVKTEIAPLKKGLETLNNNVIQSATATDAHLTALRSDMKYLKAAVTAKKNTRRPGPQPGSHPTYNKVPIIPTHRKALYGNLDKRFCVVPYCNEDGKIILRVEGMIVGKKPKLIWP